MSNLILSKDMLEELKNIDVDESELDTWIERISDSFTRGYIVHMVENLSESLEDDDIVDEILNIFERD